MKEKFVFTSAKIISKPLVLHLKVSVLHAGMEDLAEQKPTTTEFSVSLWERGRSELLGSRSKPNSGTGNLS